MQLQKFLIELVASTDGWVIVLIFSIYVGYHIYDSVDLLAPQKNRHNI